MNKTSADIDTILDRYPADPQFLIALLQDVQSEYDYISPESMTLVCDHVRVSPALAWTVATFYRSFSLEPRGEHDIKVCLGTACHLKGGGRLADNLARDLKVDPGRTTKDLKFSLDAVNCLGACALAPVVVVDGQYHSNMNSVRLSRIVRKLTADEGVHP